MTPEHLKIQTMIMNPWKRVNLTIIFIFLRISSNLNFNPQIENLSQSSNESSENLLPKSSKRKFHEMETQKIKDEQKLKRSVDLQNNHVVINYRKI